MIEILNKTDEDSKFKSKSLKCYFRILRREVRREGATSVCKALPSVTGGLWHDPCTRETILCAICEWYWWWNA